MRIRVLSCVLLALLVATPGSARDFVLFESGPVRPLAQSGPRLYAVNIPDNRLEVFKTGLTLTHEASVQVGMEPVAVAIRGGTEAWVVNHLSDSVSIVDITVSPPKVVRTLLVGDEPRDIVFANGLAFITTAHRGQHRTHSSISGVTGAGDPQLTTEGIGRADVWVFDPSNLGATLGGTPQKIVELFGDTPRALAVSNDESTVYAAVFHSGNQSTTVNEGMVCDGFGSAGACSGDGVTMPGGLGGGNMPGGNPGPDDNHVGVAAPEVGLIVQWDESAGEWQDELGRNWNNAVRFSLPDHDVFAIDTTTLNKTDDWEGVGTILFNMAVHPTNDKIYVTNAESKNLTRFEGAGTHGGSTVQGNLAQYRVSILSGTNTVDPVHLNSHINYATLPAGAGVKDDSLATPLDVVFDSTGATAYVAAMGSNKVGVLSTAALEAGTFDPTTASASYVALSGSGPAGLALREDVDRLYVYNRFSHDLAVVDTLTNTEIGSVPLRDMEPEHVVDGRHMLYDAFKTSSNGEASCSSCHIFGDFDSLAWDLGDPDGDVTMNTAPATPAGFGGGGQNGGADEDEFHPMKGPMTTQTLRGLANSGALHWRGDRVDGFFGLDDPYITMGGNDAGDEVLNFNNFIVAFPGLVGAAAQPSVGDMQDFTDFSLEIALPPNPIANLDGSQTTAQQDAETFYFNNNSDGVATCEGCHDLVPSNGFFGTGGFASFENETQVFKVAHLRNLYQKVGMFGMPNAPFFQPGDNSDQGPQVRGFGFLHDGSTDTIFRFLSATVFNLPFPGIGFNNAGEIADMEQFMLAFPSDLAPIVGQQVTDDGSAIADVATRIGTMKTRAGTSFTSKFMGGVVTECDLIAKANVGGEERGYLYDTGAGTYDPDRVGEGNLSQGAMDAIAAVVGQAVTYTCAPPGSGTRMGIDRDLDGVFDSDEVDDGTDPANPGSILGACNDGIDNDGDGLTDAADPACLVPTMNIENPQCDDGVDNDGDGAVDGGDAHCASPADDFELPPARRCGLGFEAALVLVPWAMLRARRRRS